MMHVWNGGERPGRRGPEFRRRPGEGDVGRGLRTAAVPRVSDDAEESRGQASQWGERFAALHRDEDDRVRQAAEAELMRLVSLVPGGADPCPPWKSTATPTTSPPRSTGIIDIGPRIDRESEARQVLARLDPSRCAEGPVVVRGSAGVGKSLLARAAAQGAGDAEAAGSTVGCTSSERPGVRGGVSL